MATVRGAWNPSAAAATHISPGRWGPSALVSEFPGIWITIVGIMPNHLLSVASPCVPPMHASSCTPATSNDDSSSGQSASELRQKSAKRRAAEALLQRKFSSTALDKSAEHGSSAAKRQRNEQQQRPPVRVAACSDCSGGTGHAHATPSWCANDVALPPMDWPAVLQAVTQERDMLVDMQARCYHLPGAAC